MEGHEHGGASPRTTRRFLLESVARVSQASISSFSFRWCRSELLPIAFFHHILPRLTISGQDAGARYPLTDRIGWHAISTRPVVGSSWGFWASSAVRIPAAQRKAGNTAYAHLDGLNARYRAC